ncbi:MAG TPA: hypothetical protein VK859_12345, partial [bacterium]|nr:hypothetical protein [bacterium]
YSVFNLAGPSSHTLWGLNLYMSNSIGVTTMIQAGVYNMDSGNLLATSSAIQVETNGSPQWTTFTISPPQTMIPGNYALCAWFKDFDGGASPSVYFDATGTNYYIISIVPGFQSTLDTASASKYSNTLNIYANICP